MKNLIIVSVLIASCYAGSFVNIEPAIVGGSEAAPHQYPFMTSIHWVVNWPSPSSSHVCGGVLINRLWVLTAAHCLTESPQAGRLDVLLGNHRHSVIEPGLTRIEVNRSLSIIHPDWVPGGVGPEDMALLYMKDLANYGPTIRAIRLPQNGVIPTGAAVAAGWGATGPLGGQLPDVLQHVNLNVLDNPTCREQFNNANLDGSLVDDTNVCTAGVPGGGVAVCSGDSGGPLFQGTSPNEVVIGIVSWGVIPCGSNNLPSGVFKRVSAYIDWIYEHTGVLPS